MVNAISPARTATLHCRQIEQADIAAVADLLARGFPGRRTSYWTRGLTRMATSDLPADCPRFGYMLESAGKPVGVILLLSHAAPEPGGTPRVRCNLSSWYVEPAFRSYASLLISFALRQPNVTFINISPARQTWPVVEAQGFKRFADGQFLALPALSLKGLGFRVAPLSPALEIKTNLPEAERVILLDHARLGCISLVCHTPNGDLPFVFAPFSIRAGRVRLPCMRLIYCRDARDFVDCAGALGRFLLRRRIAAVLIDANGAVPGLPGIYSEKFGRKYFKGPDAPRLGDLTYSELVVFGP